MSEENVEVVQKAIEAWNQREAELLLSYAAPEIEWMPAGPAAVERAVYRGHDEVASAYAALWETWDLFRFEGSQLRDLGDSVLWLGRVKMRGSTSHVELDQEFAAHWMLRDGKLIKIQAFLSWREALQAVGLEEEAMSEESTTRDLVERVRRTIQAANARDVEWALTFFAPDAVWDTSPMGMGTFEGLAAIRGFFEDWLGAYEEYAMEAEEIVDLGNGVTFAVLLQKGRLVGSSGEVQLRYASAGVWANGLLTRLTSHGDIDEARAAAERLAESRG